MIRKAQSSEIQKIMSVTKACARSLSSEGIHQWNEEYPNREAFEHDLSQGELYVFILSDEVIGCMTISTFKDPVYDSIQWLGPDSNHIYMHRLAVHPNFQGRGYARQMMDFAEEYSTTQRAVSIRLDTFSKNLRNQRFYEARGYQRLGDVFFPKQSEFPFHCYEKLL